MGVKKKEFTRSSSFYNKGEPEECDKSNDKFSKPIFDMCNIKDYTLELRNEDSLCVAV
jgi:hypothetical protein